MTQQRDDLDELLLPDEGCCFHCGELLLATQYHTEVLGESRAMCCMGCQLASQSIVEMGLESYYLDRSEINKRARLPSQLDELAGFDHPDVQAAFVHVDAGVSVAELSVVGLQCAACSWLIEKRLSEFTGITRVSVNLTSQRMQIAWDDASLPLSHIIHAVDQMGYEARPFRLDTHSERLRQHSKTMMMRLAVAGLGAMQAMMFAIAMYFGIYQGMDADTQVFLRWVSLVVSIPVFLYAGWPFYRSAWSALRINQVNMDVPVSLALIITFFVSAYAVIAQTGETYFDSVGMFIFFLLAGKYVEQRARLQASSLAGDLITIKPSLVTRVSKHPTVPEQQATDAQARKQSDTQVEEQSNRQMSVERVSEHHLQLDDHIIIQAGDTVPCDGVLVSECATLSESLITGESAPVVKQRGMPVLGGSQNYSADFTMQVTQLPKNSQLAMIDRLMNRALGEKPQLAKRADKIASWFVLRVLVLSALVFIGWYLVSPEKAIWATVAVLVATCPCALSLATPIALTVATNRLAEKGFLITRGHVLEQLTAITDVAFDKTGTLTRGQLQLEHVDTQDDSSQGEPDYIALAASMELGTNHPIARALVSYAQAKGLAFQDVTDKCVDTGGITAVVGGCTYKLGQASYIQSDLIQPEKVLDVEQQWEDLPATDPTVQPQMQVFLARVLDATDPRDLTVVARFTFADTLRPESAELVTQLNQSGLTTHMLTGDPSPQAYDVADYLGIAHAHNQLTPEQKVSEISLMQSQGKQVMMVGDGINDAPVLAKANISVAMANASDLAQVSADSVILSQDLATIQAARDMSQKTQRIIKQNLTWAIGYNALVLLPAAFGYVPPWLAAIGMSISSLVVVLNALRLKRM